VPPTHSSRPIIRRDGIGLLAPGKGLRGVDTSLSGLAPRSGERACKVVGRCRYWHLPGRGSWSALAPWPADRFANQVPERQAAPCRSIPPTWPKASAPWAAWTQNGAWPRRHTQGRADPLAHQDLGELLPVRLQLDVPDGGRQPLAERHRTRPLGQPLLPVLDRLGVWSDALAQRSCPSASTSISQAYQPRTAAWPSRRSAAGWSWTVG
jgi:hypothetical protein